MSKDKKLEQNRQEQFHTIFTRSLLTGFIGGLIWSMFGRLMAYFNFTEVGPTSFMLRSWLDAKWTDDWLGDVIAIVMIGVLSIVVAIVYYGLLKKMGSMWVGALFGIVLWGIVFFVLQPIFPNIPPLEEFNKNTIICSLCLFLLYGTFIGYSISYDYRDMVVRGENERTD